MKKAIMCISLVGGLAYGILAHAAFVCEPDGSEGPLQTVRNFFWMAMGFPGSTEYQCFTGGSATIEEIVGTDGLVGRIEGIRESVVNAIIAEEGDGITCETVPTSGSFSMSATETLTYATATQSPPSSFDYTTAYTKRVQYSNSSTGRTAVFEFHCDRNSMMAKIVDTLSGGTQTMVIFYDGEDSTNKQIDFYLHDTGNFGSNLKMAVVTRVYSDRFNLYMTRSGTTGGGGVQPYRFAVESSLTSGQSTIFYQDLASDGLTTGNYTSASGINDVDVTSATAPNAGASNSKRHGCASSLSINGNTITSAAACSGLDIDASPSNAFGGTMSMQWVEQNLATSMAGI